ncbi:GntR family transcriptional regulator [Geomicrobium sp. JCM 19039]|uniref:GntR family transcriptional regulator n=1 Tax=Geomicrobium sp. JCM 19039 TaxID=1460636 RepID=UPI00045F23C2|nr:GntR family transcriptional regulator [Geomicrobium sp. JCM 19039]GAK11549.1 transcriptional regulator, GntR family [Geomicrobium sp. JCM 19039]
MNTTFSHVKPLYEQAYELVKRLIMHGDIAPGQTIVVAQLAEQLQISRTPLREAFRQLLKDQLVTVDRNGTLKVMSLSLSDFEQLFDCRMILEKDFIADVRMSLTDLEIDEWRNRLASARQAVDNTADESMQTLHFMYAHFFTVCKNQRLSQLVQSTYSPLSIYAIGPSQNAIHTMLEEHEQLLTVMKSGEISEMHAVIAEISAAERARGAAYLEALTTT